MINSQTSSWTQIGTGISQRSIFDALLFSVYIIASIGSRIYFQQGIKKDNIHPLLVFNNRMSLKLVLKNILRLL